MHWDTLHKHVDKRTIECPFYLTTRHTCKYWNEVDPKCKNCRFFGVPTSAECEQRAVEEARKNKRRQQP